MSSGAAEKENIVLSSTIQYYPSNITAPEIL